jgi:hypothetical protein
VTWTLRRAGSSIQAVKDTGLRTVGAPAAHYLLLMHVHTYPGLTGAEFGRRLGVTTQAAALLATKLEASGLLERCSHPRHPNVHEFHLTDACFDAPRVADWVVAKVEHRARDAFAPGRSEQLRDLVDEVLAHSTRESTPDGHRIL